MTLDEALALYAQPKTRGRRAPAGPLRELGPDPVSGAPIVVRDGRFGPYVTDGETNATLRKADTVDAITVERAAELLAEKRAKGPAPKKRTRRRRPRPRSTAAKKTVAKKRSAVVVRLAASSAGKGFMVYVARNSPTIAAKRETGRSVRPHTVGAVSADRPNAPGFLVALEGPDGSGKSTQARLLADHLRSSRAWSRGRAHSRAGRDARR